MIKRIKLAYPQATIHLVVDKNIYAAREKFNHLFGVCREPFGALLSYNYYGHFGLFIRPKDVIIPILSHELFHLTHRIAAYAGWKFDVNNQEPFACLHEHLAARIFKILMPYDRSPSPITFRTGRFAGRNRTGIVS